MRISNVESFVVDIPFREPFVVWRGSVDRKRHVLVRVATDGRHVGWGEAPPFLFYAPETAAGVHAMITEHMAPQLVGRDPRDVRAILDAFESIDGHHFAKAAVETALWDLLGQAANLPLGRLLGGPLRQSVPVVAVLHAGEPEQLAAEARRWVARGFGRLKLKIGFGPDADEAMVAHVREAVGAGPTLRVDAEERYAVKEALAVARRLAPYAVELISQPVARTDWEGMVLLRHHLTQPLLADEGIATPADVLHCVRLGAADLVNVKVLKCGGLLRSLEAAAIAAAARRPLVVGSMIEAGVGTLLGAHFASLVPGPVTTELCGPLLFADDLLDPPVAVVAGEIRLGAAPGLGAAVSPQRLERYRVG